MASFAAPIIIITSIVQVLGITLNHLGWALAESFDRFGASLFILRIASKISALRLPFFNYYEPLSIAEMAQVYFWMGNIDAAEKTISKVAPMMMKANCSEFQCLSRTAGVFYDLGKKEQAEKGLTFAVKSLKENRSRLHRSFTQRYDRLSQILNADDIDIQATNLDLLGRLALSDGDVEKAERHFAESLATRTTLYACKAAEAYEENTKATLALARGDRKTAEEAVLKAAELFPTNISIPTDLRVLSAILDNLREISTPEANAVISDLHQRFGNQSKKFSTYPPLFAAGGS